MQPYLVCYVVCTILNHLDIASGSVANITILCEMELSVTYLGPLPTLRLKNVLYESQPDFKISNFW